MSNLSRSLRRTFFQLMRGIKPVATFGDTVYVFRDAEVREVLTRDKDFTLREVNAEKVERRIGAFLLSLDDGPQYRLERGIVQRIISRDDPQRIRTFVRTTAADLLAQLCEQPTFDLVQAYTRIVPLRLLESYFGTPGPDDATMLKWNRDLFWDIFLNLKDKPEPAAAGEKSAGEMSAYLDELIAHQQAAIQAGEEVGDTLLSRLLRLQGGEEASLDNDGIRRNLSGILLGAEETTSNAFVNILTQIIQRPTILARAREAAQNGDIETMGKIAFEALRFRPNLPAIIRFSSQDQVLGTSGKKAYKIAAGKRIFALVASAMLDKRRFPKPNAFLEDRPREDYLFFGHGLHKCYGNYINYITIPEMLMALLKHENLRPAKNKIMYEGPFPDQWIWKTNAS